MYQYLLGDRPAVIAPPESEWYHGRLDRYSAEQRLKQTGKLGTYLGNEKMFSIRYIYICIYVYYK